MFKTLNDAAVNSPVLAQGPVKVWYHRPEIARDVLMGLKFARDMGATFDKDDLSKTHILLGEIKGGEDLDDVYMALQGEVWSPEGEARELITSLGLSHTSMSCGDIIQIGDKAFFVDSFGFTEL